MILWSVFLINQHLQTFFSQFNIFIYQEGITSTGREEICHSVHTAMVAIHQKLRNSLIFH